MKWQIGAEQSIDYQVGYLSYPKPKWSCHICNGFEIRTNKAPNAFNRMMQKLVFGFVWKRLDEEKTCAS